jgi:hypothetical protein
MKCNCFHSLCNWVVARESLTGGSHLTPIQGSKHLSEFILLCTCLQSNHQTLCHTIIIILNFIYLSKHEKCAVTKTNFLFFLADSYPFIHARDLTLTTFEAIAAIFIINLLKNGSLRVLGKALTESRFVNQNSVLPATLIINLLKDGRPWSCSARSPNPEQNC